MADDDRTEVHFAGGQKITVVGEPASIAAAIWPGDAHPIVRTRTSGVELQSRKGNDVFVNPGQVLYVTRAAKAGVAQF